MQSTAFIFDMNGTMIDDMNYHIRIWWKLMTSLGSTLNLEQVKAECYGKNSEVLERVFPGRFSNAEKDALEIQKENLYQEEYRPHMKLINGLDEVLALAEQQQVPMSIGTAAIRYNVDFILDGLQIRKYFKGIVTADDVVNSKPDPETFLKCATLMGVEPANCIVFEDAPKGVETALNAGMKCVVLTTMHEAHEFAGYPNILQVAPDYTGLNLQALL